MSKRNKVKEDVLKHLAYMMFMDRFGDKSKTKFVDVFGKRTSVRCDYSGEVVLQWVSAEPQMDIPKDTLTLCMTNPYHDWGIAMFVGGSGSYEDPWVVREIGTNRECRIYNEMLQILIGIRERSHWCHSLEEYFLDGWKRRIHRYAAKSFAEKYNDGYVYDLRFCYAVFVDEETLRITYRRRWGDVYYTYSGPNPMKRKSWDVVTGMCELKKRTIDIKVNKKTRIVDIVKQLKEQNFDRDWDGTELDLDSSKEIFDY